MAHYKMTALGHEKANEEENEDLGELMAAIESTCVLRESGKLKAPLDNTVDGLEWWFLSMIDKLKVVGSVMEQMKFRAKCIDRSDAVAANLKILVERGWVEEVELPK